MIVCCPNGILNPSKGMMMRSIGSGQNQQLQLIGSMINNYGSRSYSFRSFKKAHSPSLPLPQPSPIFAPHRSRQPYHFSPDSKASYLGITYASPQQYYTNNNNNKLARLECHLSGSQPTDSPPGRHKRFPNSIFPIEQLQQQLTQEKKQEEGEDSRSRCIYNYFANLCRSEAREEQPDEKEERPKAKSILMIRKINKKKEEIIERTREKLENEFRNRKQIPIHHTQFHFHKRQKAKTEHSPQPQQHKKDFTQKIYRAVEEILRLRASLKQPQQSQTIENEKEIEEVEHSDSYIPRANNYQFPCKQTKLLKGKSMRRQKKKQVCEGQAKEDEIGPWIQVQNNESDALF